MFSQLKAVLIDLSGTIHIESNEIVGSIDALIRLRRSGLRYKFVTNTTKESQNFLFERLKSIGFDIEKNEIFTPLLAAKEFILKERLRPHLLLEDSAMEDFNDILNNNDVELNNGEAVVVGLAPNKFNYNILNESFRKLLNGSRLIAIHKGRYYRQQDGLSLGPGPFVQTLAYGANIPDDQIKCVGKPDKEFFLSAIQSIDDKIKPEECLMIGDDVMDDIAGAMSLGMKGVLVKTGKYRNGDENKIDPAPTMVSNTLAEAIETILCDMCN